MATARCRIPSFSSRSALSAACVALILGACAQAPKPQTATVAESAPAGADKVAAASTATDTRDGKQAAPAANPVVISFERLSIKLDDQTRKLIAQQTDRAKASGRLVITGFCDRHQVGNARDAAIARAGAVRDELVKLGVPTKKIQIKYVTEAGNKHVAEIQFHAS